MNRAPTGEYPAKRRDTSRLSHSDPDFTILAELVPQLERLAAAKPMKVLDFGAGNGPYRHMFQGAAYIAADIEQNQAGDIDLIVGDLPLPLDDESVDLVLCIYVLEHLRDHSEVLRELHRILRPGGTLFVVTPFMYREHEAPNDFHRPTVFALRSMLELFGETEIRKVGNAWFTLYTLVNEKHIREGEIAQASFWGRWVRAGFNRIALPLLNRTLFSRPPSENHTIYHSLFAISTKKDAASTR